MAQATPTQTTETPRPRGESRRAHLVDAALTVIAESGPDALTHRRVAAEAGVPLGATTYWFESKEELVAAAFDLAADRDLARLAERRLAALTWTRATIAEELAQTLYGQLASDRSVVILDFCMWVEAIRRPELSTVAQRWGDAYLDFYLEVLQRMEPTTTAIDARIVSAAVEGLCTQELLHKSPPSLPEFTTVLERLFAAVLGPVS